MTEQSFASAQPTQEDKTWAMIAHVVPLAAMWFSAGFLGFVAGIVVWVYCKDKGPLSRNYGAQALNIQLNALIWFIPSFILCLVLIGFILVPIVAIWATILHIIALLKVGDNQLWKPPFCIQFIK